MAGYTLQELCNSIYEAVKNADMPLSRLEICRAIGRKKSPHIVAMIEHLTDTGYFRRGEGLDHWKRAVFYYTTTDKLEGACTDILDTPVQQL